MRFLKRSIALHKIIAIEDTVSQTKKERKFWGSVGF
jgi:hypothetical protein